MITYVNTVLVSNLASGAILAAAPAAVSSMNTPSADAGKFIIANCDPILDPADPNYVPLYISAASDAAKVNTIKVGIITKKNAVHIDPQTKAVTYLPIIKWSNIIKKGDIKSFNALTYTADTEDAITIDFTYLDANVLALLAQGGKRIIVRLTFKDLPTRFRKWTESYEYVTVIGDTTATIASNIATLINKQWKRARVTAVANGSQIVLTAMPYDDDDAVETLNWANKVRFNANLYYTDPAAEGWESTNKNFPKGVSIVKVPGIQYAATAKLVRDHEAQAMGYEGILNRGEGTWPVIKPAMETDINAHYDALTLEFENLYRTADDLQRRTKQTLEVYGLTGQLASLKAVLEAFIG